MNYEPIRWTIGRAAQEFDFDPKTVSKYLKRSGAETGDGRTFTTKQVADALFGDFEKEKTRLTRAQADREESENAEREKRLWPADMVRAAQQNVFHAIRRKVCAIPDLTEKQREAILAEVRDISDEDVFVELQDGV